MFLNVPERFPIRPKKYHISTSQTLYSCYIIQLFLMFLKISEVHLNVSERSQTFPNVSQRFPIRSKKYHIGTGQTLYSRYVIQLSLMFPKVSEDF